VKNILKKHRKTFGGKGIKPLSLHPLSEREAVFEKRAFFETDDIANKAAVQGNPLRLRRETKGGLTRKIRATVNTYE